MPSLNVDTLSCVYFAMFLLGVGYALFIVITGGLTNIDMPNVDIDVPQIDLPGDVDIPGAGIHIGGPEIPAAGFDAPDIQLSPLSPVTIATFVTTFGGIGVLAVQFFGVDPRWSLLWATAGALVLSGLVYLFYSQILVRSQASSEVRRSELIGVQAEVTVPIGETALGQVTYLTKSGRMNSMARSIDGSAIPRGQFVEIVRLVGQVALVKPVDMALEDENGQDEKHRAK
jgi:membrane protein implicated in regulation of membrane protease activity